MTPFFFYSLKEVGPDAPVAVFEFSKGQIAVYALSRPYKADTAR